MSKRGQIEYSSDGIGLVRPLDHLTGHSRVSSASGGAMGAPLLRYASMNRPSRPPIFARQTGRSPIQSP